MLHDANKFLDGQFVEIAIGSIAFHRVRLRG
jgi:hypothetical protein